MTVTGTVAGTAFVAVDSASGSVVARQVAVVQTNGSKVFTIKVQSGKKYKFYLVENEGTSDERVFPLYIGSGNKVSVASGTCDLGFVTTTGDGIATPATTPAQFTGAVEDTAIPDGVATNRSYLYTQADLTGTWYGFQLYGGSNPYYARGTMPIDANGAGAAINVYYSDGHLSTNTITAALVMTPSGVVKDTLSSGGDRFVMSRDKSLMVGVGNAGLYGAANIFILVKAGGTFQQSDLAGKWKMHGLLASSTFREWQRGDVSIDANGVMTISNSQRASGGSSLDGTKSFGLSVNSSGIVTATAQGGSVYGALTADKNVAVFVVSNADGTIALHLLVRTGGTFSSSDLVGSHRSNSLTINATQDYWQRSLTVVNSNGIASKYATVENGVSKPDSVSTVSGSMSTTGIYTGKNKAEGIMSLNKKLFVETFSDGTSLDYYGLGIALR